MGHTIITCKEAKAKGLKHYYTHCNKCGCVAKRYVIGRRCVECERREREDNPERFREYERKRRAADPEKYRERDCERQRKYRENHLEKERERVRQWQKDNRENALFRAKDRKRRVRKHTPEWAKSFKSPDGKLRKLVHDERRVFECLTGEEHHVDHIWPLKGWNGTPKRPEDWEGTWSGLHVSWNMEPLPGAENKSKHNSRPDRMGACRV